MEQSMVIQRRHVATGEIAFIRGLMVEQPDWGRTRLSKKLCRRWDWGIAPPDGSHGLNDEGRKSDIRTIEKRVGHVLI